MSITNGTFPGVRIVDMPDLGAVSDSSSFVGERAGSGRFSALALRNYVESGTAFTPQMYGAKGDGVTDDTFALQAAINAAQAAHRSLYVVGTSAFYLVSAPLTITSALNIYGDFTTTIIKTSSPTADLFQLTSWNVAIHDMVFGATVTRTAGSYIDIPLAIANVKISRCEFNGHAVGITLGVTGSSVSVVVDISECKFNEAISTTGIGIVVLGGLDLTMRHIIMNSGATPPPLAGIQLKHCGDLVMHDVGIINHVNDLLINPGDGQAVESLYATDCFFDTSTGYGVLVIPSGTGRVQRSRFIGCWFSSHGVDGVRTTSSGGAAIIKGLEFVGCHAYDNAGSAFNFTYGGGFSLIGCQAASNPGAGVACAPGISDVTVTGCRLGPGGGFGPNGYGVFVDNGAGDHIIITNNHLQGNTTAGLNFGASGTHTITTPNLTA